MRISLLLFLLMAGNGTQAQPLWQTLPLGAISESRGLRQEVEQLNAGGQTERKRRTLVEAEGLAWHQEGDVLHLENPGDRPAWFRVAPQVWKLDPVLPGIGLWRVRYQSARSLTLAYAGAIGRQTQTFAASETTGQISLRMLPLLSYPKDRPTLQYLEIQVPGQSQVQILGMDFSPGATTYPALINPAGELIHSGTSVPEFVSEPKRATGPRLALQSEPVKLVQEKSGRWALAWGPQHFFSAGVTGVRLRSQLNTADVTLATGREYLFQHLPPADSFPEAWFDAWHLSFYAANSLRRYGSSAAWRADAAQKLERWGFNTLGCWSDTNWAQQAQTALLYTVYLQTAHDSLRKHEELVDAFHPRLAHYLRQNFALARRHRDNARVLGYFVDNEKPWHRLDLFKTRMSKFGWRAWSAFLRQRYGTLAKVNEAWLVDLKAWDQVNLINWYRPYYLGPPARDWADFHRLFARRYFATIDSVLTELDNRHLKLGCRFLRTVPGWVLQEAAPYQDVVSLNSYEVLPIAVERFWKETGKPILLSEYHFPLRQAEGLPQALYETFTASQRQQMVRNILRYLLDKPYVVGAHWYQWADQPPSGRGGNGENQVVGLVDVRNRPHADVIEAYGEQAPRYVWESR